MGRNICIIFFPPNFKSMKFCLDKKEGDYMENAYKSHFNFDYPDSL